MADPTLPKAHVQPERVCPCCGYNVHGLEKAGNCPECGTPIAAAFAAPSLEFVDPTWLQRLRWAARCSVLACVALVLGIIGGCLGIGRSTRPQDYGFAAAGALLMLAAWLAAAPNPAIDDLHFNIRRRAARVAAALLILAILAELIGPATRWSGIELPVLAVVFAWTAAWYYRALADRFGITESDSLPQYIQYVVIVSSLILLAAVVMASMGVWSGLCEVIEILAGVVLCLAVITSLFYPAVFLEHVKRARNRGAR